MILFFAVRDCALTTPAVGDEAPRRSRPVSLPFVAIVAG